MASSARHERGHTGLSTESGFALPIVILAMVAATGFATAMAFLAISTLHGSTRDRSSKSAFSVAESGVADAMLRFNMTAAPTPCAPVTGSGPDANGWCGPVDIADAPTGGTVRYWVHPRGVSPSRRCASSTACMEIVSIGALGGTSRRIDATASSASGQPLFADAGVKTQDGIQMDSNASIHSGVATNGSMTLSANASQCGPVTVGPGRSLTLTSNAGQYADVNCTQPTTVTAQAPLSLPPVNQADAPSRNDNGRFFALDPVSGNKGDVCFNGRNADGTSGSCGARELSISHNSALTIGGSVYSLCKLTMSSNSKLYTASGAQVKIYFDSPEACGLPSGSAQLQLDSNTRITTSSTAASSIALLFVGSATLRTRIQANSNTDANALCQQNFVVYAPLTDITLNSNSTYCGALGGKSLTMNSNAEIFAGTGVGGFVLPNTSAYFTFDPAGFVECAAAAATPPNTGC
jgi:Tfp pilus assembly protein PilX